MDAHPAELCGAVACMTEAFAHKEQSMSVRHEIEVIEERLRQAELGPDPSFFQEALADDAVFVSNGDPAFSKRQVVEAHRPGNGPKFTAVEMTDMSIVEQGPAAAVVTGKGTYEAPGGTFTLKFMRVWLKKNDRWQVVAASVNS
jgi:Domain of unknown function (DUF4440)